MFTVTFPASAFAGIRRRLGKIWRRILIRLGDKTELAFSIDLAYRHFLNRPADPIGIEGHMAAVRNGIRYSAVVESIARSPEAALLTFAEGEFPGAWPTKISDGDYPVAWFPNLSDGEFILNTAQLLFELRGATAKDIDHWRRYLAGNTRRRGEFTRLMIDGYVARTSQRQQVHGNDPSEGWIMGTSPRRLLTSSAWQKKAKEIEAAHQSSEAHQPVPRGNFKHSGTYLVSAITSLYKGRRFLEKFLESITSQTIFDRCELIIIDANSPEGERETIEKFQKRFLNIVYKRINYRISIYQAWNIGVEIARGKYLTNTNLDDLRRHDSFELQANVLDRNSDVDVVYQDFFYSMDDSLTFDEIAKFGFKSELPIVTAQNLLAFNSPHCAPMWRKALHDEVGLFDTSFESSGDWEFWLRCLSRGKSFAKINSPHVAYFVNPQGISTRPDTKGLEEQHRVLHRYARKLIAPPMLLSRKDFGQLLHITPTWDPQTSYYDVVQAQLIRLGEMRRQQWLKA